MQARTDWGSVAARLLANAILRARGVRFTVSLSTSLVLRGQPPTVQRRLARSVGHGLTLLARMGYLTLTPAGRMRYSLPPSSRLRSMSEEEVRRLAERVVRSGERGGGVGGTRPAPLLYGLGLALLSNPRGEARRLLVASTWLAVTELEAAWRASGDPRLTDAAVELTDARRLIKAKKVRDAGLILVRIARLLKRA